jgi:K+-sensing histidine kinase KdpD
VGKSVTSLELIPLITGIEFIRKYHSKITTDNLEELLDMAHTGANRLHAQIEEILNYTEMSNMGEATQEPCTVTNLLSTITTVKEMLHIELLQVFQPDSIEKPADFFIPISAAGIEIVLTELFSNAQKFHSTGTPTIEVDIDAKPDSIRLQIRDDGIQLSPEQLANIWTPYYQGEKYFTGEVKGMGLGLSMVGSMIWEVGGACQAYNRAEGKGVVIELTLPLKTWNA